MTKCIAHRGPDAEGFFSDDLASFGHRRLSIIDLSTAANQPMISQDERWVMMFNGEVYNFRELASALKVSLRTHSDTEVMLESFAAFGPEAVSQFNGMFAIALYDRRDKLMYLFRDRMGVKPLFYLQEGNRWFFSSEIKSLLVADEGKRHLTINNEAVSLFLQLGYIPEPLTIWNEIKKFPAGNYLRITKSDHDFHSWWKAEDKISATVISDLKTAKHQLRELLESAVRYRMISDVPYGVFLSGGIDSSLVTAIAQQQNVLPVKTFTIGFKEEKYNEADQAGKIATHLKTDHHEFTLSYQDALQLCDQSMDAYDEPFADSSAIQPCSFQNRHALM
jgi:asparagine synthase (glutamine-hydrolysing)